MTAGAGWPMGPFRAHRPDRRRRARARGRGAARRPGRAAHGAAAAPAAHGRRRLPRPQDAAAGSTTTARPGSGRSNGPELTKSLPPRHRVMTARVDNRVMRPLQPSALACEPCRRAARGARAALLVGCSRWSPPRSAAKGDRGVFVSKGVGAPGLRRRGRRSPTATVFSGGSLVVIDYSATHDMKVDSPVSADRERRRLAHVRARRRRQEHGVPHLGHALPRDGHRREHVQRGRRLRPPRSARQGHAQRQRRARRAGTGPRSGSARCRRPSGRSSSWRSPAARAAVATVPPPATPPARRPPITTAS